MSPESAALARELFARVVQDSQGSQSGTGMQAPDAARLVAEIMEVSPLEVLFAVGSAPFITDPARKGGGHV